MSVLSSNEENKLKIKMAKDFDVLKKQIAQHENDIKRIQNFSTKKAYSRGNSQGDLYRLKATLKNQNEIIQNSKKIDIASNFFKPEPSMNTKTQTQGFSKNANTNRSQNKLYR